MKVKIAKVTDIYFEIGKQLAVVSWEYENIEQANYYVDMQKDSDTFGMVLDGRPGDPDTTITTIRVMIRWQILGWIEEYRRQNTTHQFSLNINKLIRILKKI